MKEEIETLNIKWEFNLNEELAEAINNIAGMREDMSKIQKDIRAIKKQLKMKEK